MTADPLYALRSLSSVSPAGWASNGRVAGSDEPGASAFAELLAQARSGKLSSSLPVTIDPSSDVQLSEEQLGRLSLAADRLEAAGVRTALVVLDGRKLILDVHQRSVRPAADSALIDGVDGVLDLSTSTPPVQSGPFGPLVMRPEGADTPARGASGPLQPPASATENASLTRLLAQRRPA